MKSSCPLCKNLKSDMLVKSTRDNIGQVVKCKNCQHVFLDLGIDNSQIEAFLSEFYANDKQKVQYVKDHKDFIERIKADNVRRFIICQRYLSSSKKVLDFGAGYGLFPCLIRPLVARVCVVDQSNLTKENAAKFGFDYCVNLKDLGQSFDLITAFHSLEHVTDPVTVLKVLRVHLNQDGLLVVEIPHHNDLLLKLSRKYRSFYYQVAHLHYFSASRLKEVMRQAGLKIKEIIPTQRYGLANHMKWIFGWDIKVNSHIDRIYRFVIGRSPWADTLFFVLRKLD